MYKVIKEKRSAGWRWGKGIGEVGEAEREREREREGRGGEERISDSEQEAGVQTPIATVVPNALPET